MRRVPAAAWSRWHCLLSPRVLSARVNSELEIGGEMTREKLIPNSTTGSSCWRGLWVTWNHENSVTHIILQSFSLTWTWTRMRIHEYGVTIAFYWNINIFTLISDSTVSERLCLLYVVYWRHCGCGAMSKQLSVWRARVQLFERRPHFIDRCFSKFLSRPSGTQLLSHQPTYFRLHPGNYFLFPEFIKSWNVSH